MTSTHISLEGPLDIPASLEVFRRVGDDLIDRWDGTTLVRSVRFGGTAIAFAAVPEGTLEAPALRVTVDDPAQLDTAGRAVRSMFVPTRPGFADLVREDPVIADLNSRFPGIRPVLQLDLFTALVRSISAQQVNLRWAATTRRRLAEAFGERHEVAGFPVYSLSPGRLADASVEAIRALQFTTRKAEYIVGLARAMASGELEGETLAAMPDDDVIDRLTALRGIGLWTAEWILVRTLGRPRVVAGDLGVRKAVGKAYFGGGMPSEAEVRRATAHWGDAADIAQTLILQDLVAGSTA